MGAGLVMQKKADQLITAGTEIRGKWYGNSYTVLRKVGSGTVGSVYLCRGLGKQFALKISTLPTALAREAAMLKRFNKVRDQRLGPFLYEVDDWQHTDGVIHPFYIMEYIDGIPPNQFIQGHGKHLLGTLMMQLLQLLEGLHQEGVAFGDLKLENLLITEHPPTVRLLDVGGVSKFGYSVKEYSAFYDRAYWQLGTRRAEPEYDLFAFVMVCLALYYPKQFKRTNQPAIQIRKAMKEKASLHLFIVPLTKAMEGKYASAARMNQDIQKVLQTRVKRRQHKRQGILPQVGLLSGLSSLYYLLAHFF